MLDTSSVKWKTEETRKRQPGDNESYIFCTDYIDAVINKNVRG